MGGLTGGVIHQGELAGGTHSREFTGGFTGEFFGYTNLHCFQ